MTNNTTLPRRTIGAAVAAVAVVGAFAIPSFAASSTPTDGSAPGGPAKRHHPLLADLADLTDEQRECLDAIERPETRPETTEERTEAREAHRAAIEACGITLPERGERRGPFGRRGPFADLTDEQRECLDAIERPATRPETSEERTEAREAHRAAIEACGITLPEPGEIRERMGEMRERAGEMRERMGERRVHRGPGPAAPTED